MANQKPPKPVSLLRTHVYVWLGVILIQISSATLRVYLPLTHGGLVLLIAFFYLSMFRKWERHINYTMKQNEADDAEPEKPA